MIKIFFLVEMDGLKEEKQVLDYDDNLIQVDRIERGSKSDKKGTFICFINLASLVTCTY